MTDIVDRKTRSRMMSGIKGKNTRSEILVRKALYALGYRYRIYDKTLPGKPDLVLRKYNAVIFIHGCFWHGHNCPLFKWPKTRGDFWKEKIEKNRANDIKVRKMLLGKGWRVLEIWECSLKGRTSLTLGEIIAKVSVWLNGDLRFEEIRGGMENPRSHA